MRKQNSVGEGLGEVMVGEKKMLNRWEKEYQRLNCRKRCWRRTGGCVGQERKVRTRLGTRYDPYPTITRKSQTVEAIRDFEKSENSNNQQNQERCDNSGT